MPVITIKKTTLTPNAREIVNVVDGTSVPSCYDKRQWCGFANCILDNVKILCQRTCNSCHTSKQSIHIEQTSNNAN